jgi:putative FmdB family regulatory protein
MPIYRFFCATCNGNFEVVQRHDAPVPVCPACGGHDITKCVTAPANHRGGPVTTVAERDIPASAYAPLTPKREGTYAKDDKGHKVRVDDDKPQKKSRVS